MNIDANKKHLAFDRKSSKNKKYAHGNPCYGGAIAGEQEDATKSSRAEQTSPTTYLLANTELRVLGERSKPWWAVVKALALWGRDRRGKEQ